MASRCRAINYRMMISSKDETWSFGWENAQQMKVNDELTEIQTLIC